MSRNLFIFVQNAVMIEKIRASSILSKVKGGPDPWFGISYSMNLYRGCQHQCIYCDSRSTVYGIKDFRRIELKENAISLLETTLRKKKLRATIGTGSMNDPYMPAEEKLQMVRRALTVIQRSRFPVHVITKSDLVTRDKDLLSEIAGTYAAVSFSLSTSDPEIARLVEPGASGPAERMAAMKVLAGNGIYTGIILVPVLPFITGTTGNIRDIVVKARDHGAGYVIAWMGMTQRPGQREHYYRKLDQYFPGVRNRYTAAYGNSYECMDPQAEKLYDVLRETAVAVGMPLKMQHYAPERPSQLQLF